MSQDLQQLYREIDYDDGDDNNDDRLHHHHYHPEKHKGRLSFCLTKAEKYSEALTAGKEERVNKIVAKEPAWPPDGDGDFYDDGDDDDYT